MAEEKQGSTQVLVSIPAELLKEIDKYWHAQNLRSRPSGIRDLVEIGLRYEKESTQWKDMTKGGSDE